MQPPVIAIRGSSLKISWLREQFAVLPEDATEDVVQKHVRAYIIYLIGGQLLPDKSSSLVQLLCLPLLRDFDYSGSLSWVGAVLAYLYRGLCRACQRNVREICGPLCLLQLRQLKMSQFANYHQCYINLWANRLDQIVTGVPSTVPLPRDGEYFTRYRRITRRLISTPTDQPPMVFHPLGGRRLAMV